MNILSRLKAMKAGQSVAPTHRSDPPESTSEWRCMNALMSATNRYTGVPKMGNLKQNAPAKCIKDIISLYLS